MHQSNQLTVFQIIISIIVFALIVYLKGVVLWRASQGRQINWFTGLLIVFTLSFSAPLLFVLSPILDLVFLFRYATEKVNLSELVKKLSSHLPFSRRTKK